MLRIAEDIQYAGLSATEALNIIHLITAAAMFNTGCKKAQTAYNFLLSLSGEESIKISNLLKYFDVDQIHMCMLVSLKKDIKKLYVLEQKPNKEVM